MTNDDRVRDLLRAAMPDVLTIVDLMQEYDVLPYDIMKTLYLVANIKKIAKYGKVSIIIKNNEIVSINQEQALISDKELRRNLQQLMDK